MSIDTKRKSHLNRNRWLSFLRIVEKEVDTLYLQDVNTINSRDKG